MSAARFRLTAALMACAAVLAPLAPAAAAHAATLPRPAHVVVVIEENHSYAQIIGSSSAPYINALAAHGALFTNSHGVTHPSQPNYLALFSGSTQGITDDSCPHTFSAANLGKELTAAGLSFAGYSESMPYRGYTGCISGEYARKHNPWVDFPSVPSAGNRTFAAFPANFASLPRVSVVVPNLLDDMHNGSIARGDTWLKNHLDSYLRWARTHNSLLIVTWDENNGTAGNRIPTIIAGAHVTPGSYGQQINHYNVLRTIEDFYGLPHAGASASARPIAGIWH